MDMTDYPIGLGAADDVEPLRRVIVEKLTYAAGRDPLIASDRDWFVAAALALRDRIVDRWLSSTRSDNAAHRKRVDYLSLEFLPGRMLLDSLNNVGLTEPMRLALAECGVDLERLRAVEADPALGNGGLGRLAACFMESMASLGIPAHGFGIRYNHGLFQQIIRDGWQHEYPETGSRSAIRGNSSGRISPTRSASAVRWTARRPSTTRRRRSGIRKRR